MRAIAIAVIVVSFLFTLNVFAQEEENRTPEVHEQYQLPSQSVEPSLPQVTEAVETGPALAVATPAQEVPDVVAVAVDSVVDPLTIALRNGKRLRMIGVQPIMSGGALATSASMQYFQTVQNMVLNQSVNLVYDTQTVDERGNILAYVYLPNGTFVNAELLKSGYAEPRAESPALSKYRQIYMPYFYRLYREAKNNNRGLWR